MDELKSHIQDSLAFKLRYCMKAKGVSVPEVANYLGTHPNTVRRWMYKQSLPNLLDICKLCRYFVVDISWFLGEKENTKRGDDSL